MPLELPSLLGEEQELLFQNARRLLRERREADWPSLWRELTALGWLEVCLPVALGGPASGALSAFTLAEALGAAGVQTPFVAAVLCGWLLRDAGVAEKQRRLLEELVAGRMLVVPVVEDAPDDRRQTCASRDGSGWRLDGDKLFVECAAAADTLLVSAALSGDDGGPALFAVPRGAGGVQIETMRSAGGDELHAVRFAGVIVGAPLPAEDQVGQAVERLRLHGAALRAAELAGIGRAALELTLEYVRRRTQFGRPIGSFQAVQHHCADMLRDLVATRLLVAQAAWRLHEGLPAAREVAMAKAKASEAVPELLRLAHQVTGGVGYYRDYPLEGFYRRAIDAAASYGGPLEHRRFLAGLAAQDPALLRREDGHDWPPFPLPLSPMSDIARSAIWDEGKGRS
ncbi:MAG TPA: acyl-CoA dehydrogenase family protein [Dehalococcoidia bacterium]|nr:acyl-CoA dehydrogenase family protein [Dehalococcoidia bacterium]